MKRGQSLVEFGLIAPVLILLAMAAWDGGSAVREQLVLQQAARDGARAAATAYGGASQSLIQDAVLASASDLPALANTGGYLTVTSTAASVTVRVQYLHVLITPVLRQLWARGTGTLMLSASATFYVPQQTPVPPRIVPSTPIPTPTPSPSICARRVSIVPLSNNTGYYVSLQLTASSVITATWSINQGAGGQIELFLYWGTPFANQADPSNSTPPSNPLASSSANSNQSTLVTLVSPQSEPAGTYTAYFFKRGTGLSESSIGSLAYNSGNCT